MSDDFIPKVRHYRHNVLYRAMLDIKADVRNILTQLNARIGEVEKRQVVQDEALANLMESHNEMAAMVEKELDALLDMDPDLESLLNLPDEGNPD